MCLTSNVKQIYKRNMEKRTVNSGKKSQSYGGERWPVFHSSVIDRDLLILKVALIDSEQNTSTGQCFCKTLHQRDKCVNERERQFL